MLVTGVSLAPAHASDMPTAQSLFETGAYGKALDTARTLGTGQGYLLASEALSAQIMLGLVDDPHRAAKDAYALAEQALALMPEDQHVNVQHALAYGFLVRSSNIFTIWRKKLPAKSLAMIEDIRTRFPEDPRGDALLGAWHFGIIREAGAARAEDWYAATLKAGAEAYNSALTKAPQDILILSNYAVAFYVLDPQGHHATTEDLLTRAAGLSANTQMERDVQARMAEIMAALENPKRAKKLAENFLESKP